MDSKKLTFSIVEPNSIKIPTYEENTNTKGPVWWGPDNSFPQFINMLYSESATVRAIIDGSALYICGNGIAVNEGAAKFTDQVNHQGQTINDLCEQLATDLMKLNGFAIQVIYDKLGAIAELYALDMTRIRISADGKKVYYAKKWGQYTGKYKEYGVFDRDNIDPDNRTQIYYYKGGARTVYPRPIWEGSFRDVLAEIDASKYVLNSMANGLAAKSIITLPNVSGLLTDDDKAEVEKAIKTKFTGPEADSSFFLYWKDNENAELKVDTIKQEDESTKFINLKKAARENIFTAFRCSPNIFGLANDNTGVFSKDSYKDAFELYNKTQIKPRQKKIERAFNTILGSDDTIKFLPFDIDNNEE